jgi:hypothetical protein
MGSQSVISVPGANRTYHCYRSAKGVVCSCALVLCRAIAALLAVQLAHKADLCYTLPLGGEALDQVCCL